MYIAREGDEKMNRYKVFQNTILFRLILLLALSVTACNIPQKVTDTPLPTNPPEPTENSTPAHTNTATPTSTRTPPAPTEPADIIFHNGTVITVEKGQLLAQAVAIRANLIQAVGTNEEILALKGPGTLKVDLEGKTLMPGFIEGHSHFIINSVENGMSIEEIMDTLLSFGLTSVTEIRGHRNFIEAMLQAERNKQLRVRINLFPEYNYGILDNGRTTIDPAWHLDHEPILEPNRMLRIPGVKIFADGAAVPNRGCPYYSFPIPDEAYALYESYGLDLSDICGSARGDLYLTEAQLIEAIQGIQDRGYRAAFHAMGDAAVDAILNALEVVLKGEPNAKYRHQIHHNSGLRPDQIERYVQMDIIASVRSMFNTCEADEYIALFGENRYEWAINRYQLPLRDLHVIAEGDFARGDVNDRTRSNQLNPIFKLYGMVTHQQLRKDGSVCKPPDWLAQYPISIERTLEMLTIEPAYAVSMEEYVGSIAPGKYADLVILSGNPLTTTPDNLINLQVRMTMVNGKGEYCAAEYEQLCKGHISSKANLLPKGFHDALEGQQNRDGCWTIGWAADPDDRNIDLRIRVLVDGTEAAQATASDFRQDLKDAGECPGDTCGFSVDLWGLISHNTEHSVLIQAQDAQTSEWVNLNKTPKTLNCIGQ